MVVPAFICRLVMILGGLLYPAYSSYKTIKTKNVREYVKWMMYWIVFAFFTVIETFTDVFVAVWCPFYYEAKIIFLIWLLAPATKGSSFLYRKFIHPTLNQKEQHIDEYLTKAKDQGYHTIMHLGSRGLTVASQAFVSTAMQSQMKLLTHLRRSYSMGDLDKTGGDVGDGGRVSELVFSEDEEDAIPVRRTRAGAIRSRSFESGYELRSLLLENHNIAVTDGSGEPQPMLASRGNDLMFDPIWEGGEEVEVARQGIHHRRHHRPHHPDAMDEGNEDDYVDYEDKRSRRPPKNEVERYKESKEKQKKKARSNKPTGDHNTKKERVSTRKRQNVRYIDDDDYTSNYDEGMGREEEEDGYRYADARL